jgi:hypothetical protein
MTEAELKAIEQKWDDRLRKLEGPATVSFSSALSDALNDVHDLLNVIRQQNREIEVLEAKLTLEYSSDPEEIRQASEVLKQEDDTHGLA